jgi:hypothetical protein
MCENILQRILERCRCSLRSSRVWLAGRRVCFIRWNAPGSAAGWACAGHGQSPECTARSAPHL